MKLKQIESSHWLEHTCGGRDWQRGWNRAWDTLEKDQWNCGTGSGSETSTETAPEERKNREWPRSNVQNWDTVATDAETETEMKLRAANFCLSLWQKLHMEWLGQVLRRHQFELYWGNAGTWCSNVGSCVGTKSLSWAGWDNSVSSGDWRLALSTTRWGRLRDQWWSG